jgi:hypothetical protein
MQRARGNIRLSPGPLHLSPHAGRGRSPKRSEGEQVRARAHQSERIQRAPHPDPLPASGEREQAVVNPTSSFAVHGWHAVLCQEQSLAVQDADSPPKAFLVKAKQAPPIDPQLPIWELPSSNVFFQRRQVWVHSAFGGYRKAYKKAFPEENIDGKILSHAMNRRTAALKGFAYVRITPTSRGCNSSSAFSESWAVTLHSSPKQMEANRRRGAFIQYADLSDLMVMLDIKVGGGVMAVVNEGQKLVTPRTE